MTATATGGNVDIGATIAGNNVSVTGNNVFYDSISGTAVTLNATAGQVLGSSTGNIDAITNINLDATTSVTVGAARALAGTTLIDAGSDISFTSASSGSGMTVDAGGNIFGGTVTTSPLSGDATFDAVSAITLGNVSTRILSVDAGTDMTLGTISAVGRNIRGIAIDLDAGDSITYTSLNAGRGIDIDGDAVSGGDILADDSVNIESGSISIGDVTNAEAFNVTLNATAGDLTAGDISNTTFGIVASATGAVTLGNLLVTGSSNASDIDINAGTDLTIGDADAGDRLTMVVGGNLIAGNLFSNNTSPGTRITVTGDAQIASLTDSDGPANLDIGGALTHGAGATGVFETNGALNIIANSVDVTAANSLGQNVNVTARTGSVLMDSATAGTFIDVVAATLASVGSATSIQETDLTGQSVVLGSGTIGRSLTLTANTGDITATGTYTITNDLRLNALVGNVDATGTFTVGNNIDLNATLGDIAFDSLQASAVF